MFIQKNKNDPVSAVVMAWLLSAIGLSVIPHLLRLPLIVTVIFISVFLFALLIQLNKIKAPNKIGLFFLTVAIVLMVFFSHGTLIGRDAGISLLVAMCAIKLLEVSTHRDVYITVLIGFFVLVTHLFYSYSLLFMLYLLVCLILLLSTLLEVSRCEHIKYAHIKNNIAFSSTILLQSVPIMLILFFFFPRFASPLWGLPNESLSSSTGLSNSMEIGSINSLIQSDAVAFRVEFKDASPENKHLYWRGPVLTQTDGRSWYTNAAANSHQRFTTHVPFSETKNIVSYTVTMEPSKNPWIFALDLPTSIPRNSRLTSNYQLIYNEPINGPILYRTRSALNYKIGKNNPHELSESLQLPEGINPRTVAYGKALGDRYANSQYIINAVLDHFNKNDFSYTLTPPLLNTDNPIDLFFFNTKRGFCEHYSAAFTILLRAAGIPARIVTGYQGGETNPIGNYLIVRQRDAHAWVEVWLDDIGWMRVDPTSAIAPNRIESGSSEIFPNSEKSELFSLYNPMLINLRYSLDWVNNQWTQWVINYDYNQQSSFLNKLGLQDWSKILFTMVVLLMLFCGMLAIYILHKSKINLSPQNNYWNKFCHKLSKIGFTKHPYEGPRDYYRRIVHIRPDLNDEIKPIFDTYIKINYASQNRKLLEKHFKQTIKKFNPRP